MVRLQIFQVAPGPIENFMGKQPPEGISGHGIHPAGGRGDGAVQIQTVFQNFVGAVGGKNGHFRGIDVSAPYQPIPLDAVPEIFLHVEISGVDGGFIDVVDPRVGTGEGAFLLQIPADHHALNHVKLDGSVIVHQFDVHKAEAAFIGFVGAEEAHVQHHVPVGVVVGGSLFRIGRHGFGDGFAKAYLQVHPIAGFRRYVPGIYPDAAVEFAAEIHQHAGAFAGGVGQFAGGPEGRLFQRDLAGTGIQQGLRAGDLAGGAHHAHGDDILADPGIRGIGLRFEHMLPPEIQ